MKVILIEEDRFAEVVTLMRREGESAARRALNQPWYEHLTEQQRSAIAQDVFRAINYHFVRWAQSHGASCVER